MNNKIKITIIIVVILAAGAVVFSLFQGDKSEPNQPGAPINEQIEPIIEDLTQEQKQSINQFAKNFLQLYNTYSFEDFSNLEALGDYQTENAQRQTLEKIEKLREELLPGFKYTALVDEGSIEIKTSGLINKKIRVEAKILGKEEYQAQASGGPRTEDSYRSKDLNIKAELELVPFGNGWLVDRVSINF